MSRCIFNDFYNEMIIKKRLEAKCKKYNLSILELSKKFRWYGRMLKVVTKMVAEYKLEMEKPCQKKK